METISSRQRGLGPGFRFTPCADTVVRSSAWGGGEGSQETGVKQRTRPREQDGAAQSPVTDPSADP